MAYRLKNIIHFLQSHCHRVVKTVLTEVDSLRMDKEITWA